jgi:hypothetical protein
VNRAGALQQAGTGVKQYGLRTACHQRIAGGHAYCDRFMPQIEISGTDNVVHFLPDHGFPRRCPFGARTGEDIVDAERAESRENCFAAVYVSLHGDHLSKDMTEGQESFADLIR